MLAIPRYHPITLEPIAIAPIFRQYSDSDVIKRHAKFELGTPFPKELTEYFKRCGPMLKSLIIEMKIVNQGSTEILQYLNNIENLDVYTSSILSDEEEFGFITEAFYTLQNLIRLRLTTVNKLSRFNKFLILQSLSTNCKYLKSLVFEINEMIPIDTPVHPDFYRFEFPNLREIHLKYMQLFTKDEVYNLSENCPLIEIFHISSSSFSDECVRALVHKLQKLKDFLMSNVKDVTDVTLEHIVQFCKGLQVNIFFI